MLLQLWEPSTDVVECLFEEGGCKWTKMQSKECQLPFPADLDGTSCSSDPARSLIDATVFPNLTDDDYANVEPCTPVTGSNPIDLWKIDGLPADIANKAEIICTRIVWVVLY